MKIVTRVIIIVLVLLGAWRVNELAAKVIDERIYIVPCGAVDRKIIEELKDRLPGVLPMTAKAEIESEMAIPTAAYDRERAQYNAQKIADAGADKVRLAVTNERALVIIDKDIFVPGSDYLYGFADAKNGVAVVSLTRLGKEFSGVKPDRKVLIGRALKTALRELGLSWKMEKCPSAKCPLSLPAGVADIDKMRDSYCYKCRVALERVSIGETLIGSKLQKK